MAVRNAAATLASCLESVAAQSYRGPLDVTVALAPEHDSSAELLEQLRSRMPAPGKSRSPVAMQVIDNPRGITSTGLNLAIAACSGDVVVRVDAQSRIPRDYIERAVAKLVSTGSANVGGIQKPVGTTGLSRIIAAAMSSPFGAGPARFRRFRQVEGSAASPDERPLNEGPVDEGPVDTVYLGVFDRAALEAVGGFDESLIRNQDYELNWRLRKNGWQVWLDPELVVEYTPRSSWSELARQYFDYGAWKRTVLIRRPGSFRARQGAAPALLMGLGASGVALVIGKPIGLILPLVYAAAAAAAAHGLRDRLSQRADRAQALLAFAVMHLAWGSGFWFGRTRGGKPLHQPSELAAR